MDTFVLDAFGGMHYISHNSERLECCEEPLAGLITISFTHFDELFHQGNTTIRSVWGRLHTGSSPAIRTIEQPRDIRPGAVAFFGLS